jgi:hypothetical protein
MKAPDPNVRVVVLGLTRAERDLQRLLRRRAKAERLALKVERELDQIERQLQRVEREVRRGA